MWDVGGGRELRTLTGHSDSVMAAAVTPDGHRVVSASIDDTVRLWDFETGAILASFSCDTWAYSCAVSNAVKLIVAGGPAVPRAGIDKVSLPRGGLPLKEHPLHAA